MLCATYATTTFLSVVLLSLFHGHIDIVNNNSIINTTKYFKAFFIKSPSKIVYSL